MLYSQSASDSYCSVSCGLPAGMKASAKRWCEPATSTPLAAVPICSFARTRSDTIDEVHAADAEEDEDVVATTTRAGFTLGLGLGAIFEVAFNGGISFQE